MKLQYKNKSGNIRTVSTGQKNGYKLINLIQLMGYEIISVRGV